ncbi:hypothetical protein F2Q69_00020469 [Brassica cretica]|uniref:Uncharacterized protein n=1 Tax=Brassica cretica TaxID=69181 RepID=A0A8S9QP75_BRACR|nr:hypothetical protein F2Q69_00020469 [Brassica cretica]
MAATKIFFITWFSSFTPSKALKDYSDDSQKTSRNTLDKSSNAFYARQYFRQDFHEVFRSLLPKVVQILDMYFVFFRSESDFGKLLRRLSEDFLKSSNPFYAIRLPTKSSGAKSSGSLLKSSAQNMSQTFEDFSKESWKTLGRLLKDFLGSLLMYFMLEDFPRSLREVFRSLLPKVGQMNDVKWSPSLSMLRNDI